MSPRNSIRWLPVFRILLLAGPNRAFLGDTPPIHPWHMGTLDVQLYYSHDDGDGCRHEISEHRQGRVL